MSKKKAQDSEDSEEELPKSVATRKRSSRGETEPPEPNPASKRSRLFPPSPPRALQPSPLLRSARVPNFSALAASASSEPKQPSATELINYFLVSRRTQKPGSSAPSFSAGTSANPAKEPDVIDLCDSPVISSKRAAGSLDSTKPEPKSKRQTPFDNDEEEEEPESSPRLDFKEQLFGRLSRPKSILKTSSAISPRSPPQPPQPANRLPFGIPAPPSIYAPPFPLPPFRGPPMGPEKVAANPPPPMPFLSFFGSGAGRSDPAFLGCVSALQEIVGNAYAPSQIFDCVTKAACDQEKALDLLLQQDPARPAMPQAPIPTPSFSHPSSTSESSQSVEGDGTEASSNRPRPVPGRRMLKRVGPTSPPAPTESRQDDRPPPPAAPPIPIVRLSSFSNLFGRPPSSEASPPSTTTSTARGPPVEGCHPLDIFVTPPDECFHCTIGGGPLKDAVVLPCGHSFCHDCIKDWLNRKRECPIDTKPVPQGTEPAPNFVVRSFIEAQKCKCDQKGCTWTGTVADFSKHSSSHKKS